MKKKEKLGRKLLSFLLTLAMVMGLVPGMSLTAQAETTTYTNLIPAENDDESALSSKVVKFNNIDWYIIKDESTAANAGTVTLLAKDPIGKSKFGSSNAYSGSDVKTYLDNLTGTGGSFASVAGAIETVKVKGSDSDDEVDAKLWLLSTTEVNNTYQLPREVRDCSTPDVWGYNWWLRSPGADNGKAACVSCDLGSVYDSGTNVSNEYGVRPALKLDLSKVTFDSNTFEKVKSVTPKIGNTTTGEVSNGDAIPLTKYTGSTFPVSGNYYLDGDLSVTERKYVINNGQTLNLDLNGHSITFSEGYGPDILINGGGVFNLFDSVGTGSITVGNNTAGSGNSDRHGGFIKINSGTFNMYGGTINGGTVANDSAYGGIVYVSGADGNATFNLYDGKLTRSSGANHGGGVQIGEQSSLDISNRTAFYMYGGEISGNNGSWGGGIGIYGKVYIFAGEIKNNNASRGGGGIELEKNGKLYIYGGSIKGNRITDTDGDMYKGGGVHVPSGSEMHIKGNMIIKDNYQGASGTVQNNVFVRKEAEGKVILDGPLTNTAQIGVQTNASLPFNYTTNYSVYHSSLNADTFFFSDKANVSIAGNNSGEVSLAASAPVIPTINTQPEGGTIAPRNNIILNVAASVTDNGTLSYQWYKAAASDVNGTAINGGTDTSFSASEDGYYYCVVTNTLNSMTAVKASDRAHVIVSKVNPVANAPTATATYGQTLANVTLTNPSGNTPGTWEWAVETSTNVGNVGSHSYKANFIPEDTEYYNTVNNVDVTVIVGKADPSATTPTATATYGQTLADVTLTNPDGNTPGTWEWAVETSTNVGNVGSHSYKANFTPTDTNNYKSVSDVDVTVTVAKADNPATVTSNATVLKGGHFVDLANNVALNGATGAVTYEISGEANGCSLTGSVLTSGNNQGTLIVNVNVASDENYNALAATSITVTITNKNPQTITATDVTATYGDTDKSVSASVTTPTTGGGAISYTVKDGSVDYIDVASDGKLTIKKVPPTDGKAYVIVTAAETDDYAETTKEVTVTISKAEATVAAKDQSIYVGGTVPTLSGVDFYTVTGLVGTDTLTTAPTLVYQKNGSAATPDSATAGTYDIVPSGASAGNNYNISYTNGTLTISEKQPATVTKVPTAKTLTYTGSAQVLLTAGTAAGGEMQYALGTDATTVPNDGWSTSIPAGTDAKTYYVWYMAKGDGLTHTDSDPVCITVTILISAPSGGGGSASEGTSPTTPTTPTQETYTVSIENESSLSVATEITDGNAKVSEITGEQIQKITANSEETGGSVSASNTITIDVSGATQEVNSVELTKGTVERLADTAMSNNSVDTVTIQMTNAAVEMDAKTLEAVSQQATDDEIRLVVEDTQHVKLTAEQQSSIRQYTSAATFEAYFISGGTRIGNFKGGVAKVSVKYTLQAGNSRNFLHMIYLPVIGGTEYFPSRYFVDAKGYGWVQGDLLHFSDYAIVYDENKLNQDGELAMDPYSGLNQEAFDPDKSDFVEDDATVLANGKTAYQNGISLNSGLKLYQKGSTLGVTWGKVAGADGYRIYAAYCGSRMPAKPIKVTKNTKYTIKKLNGKKLNFKKNYKVYVVAYKKVDGVDKVLGRTVTAHVVGRKNAKFSNPKKLTITSKTNVSLKTGKTTKVKAKVTLVSPKRKSLSDGHAPLLRFASSNKKVATVDKTGKVKGIGKGTCVIYVYAKNGYTKKVKITVK